MNNPLVSIIIPTYNRADLITETLDSVLAQTYENWECIIVDDGSTDKTDEVVGNYVKKDVRFQYFKRPETKAKGGNSCRNYGLEKCKGDYVNWVDSDDIIGHNHLQLHVNCHASSLYNLDASVTNAKVFQNNIHTILRNWSEIVPKNNIIDEMVQTSVLWQTGGVVWNRKSIGIFPFNEDLFSSQEWTFHLSQLIKGMKYELNAETTIFIREHEHRVGKDFSEKKCSSTFQSRVHILDKLNQAKLLTPARERALLGYIFTSLRNSIHYKYPFTRKKIVNFLTKKVFKSYHILKILRVLFIAYPIYSITGKGNKLFK